MTTSEKIKLLFSQPGKFLTLAKNVLVANYGKITLPEGGNRFSTDLEVKTLKKYSSRAKLGIVEIGVLDGGTTKEIGSVATVPIYGIDPIIPDSMNKRLLGHEEIIKKNMAFYSKFFFIKDFSYNVAKNWNKPFDFIFIDGDHEYEAVKQDFEDWFKLISPGGFIAFHDSAPVTSIPGAFQGWAGPIKLVSELKIHPGLEFAETQDSITVFKKK